MMGGDDGSLSLVSTWPDIENTYSPSPTDQHTDDFEFFYHDDDDYLDEDNSPFDTSSDGSTSVAPSVHRHEFEHGRRYHSYKSGRYPLPNDQPEQHLEELRHQILLDLMEGHLFLSDIGDYPQKIIDIGTGAGAWAIDVADKYPSASVIGTDLSPIQPAWLPVNIRMFVEDCEEDEWLHGAGFELAHLRCVSGFLRDQDVVIAKIYKNLKTGGWIEFQDFMHEIFCDDGSMKDEDPLKLFAESTTEGMRRLGCCGFGIRHVEAALQRAGFTSVRMTMKKIPIGEWAQDEKLQSIGLLMKTLVFESLSAFAAKPLEAVGMSKNERKGLIKRVRESLDDRKVHRYVKFYFCYGKKEPELVSDLGSDISFIS